MPAPRVGIFGGDEAVAHGLDHLVAEVGKAERDGFASYWVTQKRSLDALTALALVGQAVPRIELGTAVIPIQPRHPVVLAGHALTTQLAIQTPTADGPAQGRLALGIGVSHRALIEGWYGIAFERPYDAMCEYLQVLRPLLHGERAEFRGRTVGAEVELTIAGAAPCPIVLGALGPRMLQLAGAVGDGTITWAVGPRTLERLTVPVITAAAEQAGRPPPRIIGGFAICVTREVEAARARAREIFRLSREYPSYRRVLDLEGAADVGDIAVVGSADEVLERIEELGALGVTDIACTEIGADPEERRATRAALAQAASRAGAAPPPPPPTPRPGVGATRCGASAWLT
jgi:F420-dependent oxidoreductase-like protein